MLSVPASAGSRYPYSAGARLDVMTTASEATPRSATSKDSTTDNRSGRVLALVLAAQFMALLDIFIVNVAAPTIRSELHASGAGLQLVVVSYTITYAVLLITGARLGDLLGHGRAHLAGLGVFTAASLTCGLAAGTGQLIAFRLVQGAAAAVMIPQVLSLIQRHFTGEARIRALGAYSAVLATGAAAGQVLGGVLVSADLFGAGWRPVFLVNVPIGLVLLVLGGRVLPSEPRTAPGRVQARARGLDLPGLVLLAAAVTLLTVPLVLGQELDWPVWSRFCMAVSVGLFAVFAAYESRLAARGGAPLIAPRVLRVPGIARAALRILLVMAINSKLPFCHDAACPGRSGLFAAAGGADVRTDGAGVRRGRTDLAAVAHRTPRGPGARRVRTRGGRLRGRRTSDAWRRRRRARAVCGLRGDGCRPGTGLQPHPYQGAGGRASQGRGRRERCTGDGHPARTADRGRRVRHALSQPP